MSQKVCVDCGHPECYVTGKKNPVQLIRCHSCHKIGTNRRINARRAADPNRKDKERNKSLWLKHRITLEQFDQKLSEQGGICAICGTDIPGGHNWHLDHDRSCCPTVVSCGKCTRGIVCFRCNTKLGMLEQSDWVALALAYIANHTP